MPMRLPPLDDDIYQYLQSQAVPLEDDINSVLRRLLGLSGLIAEPAKSQTAEATRRILVSTRQRGRRDRKRPRALKGSILAEEAYEIPILRVLSELGGSAPTSVVMKRLGKLLDGRLTAADREKLASGDLRWRNRAQFARLSLIKKGDMKANSPRGIWELSDQGHQRVQGAAR